MMKKMVLSFAPAWVLLTVPMSAWALEVGECRSDADCSEGATCEKAQWVNGCDPRGGDDSGDGVSPAPVDPDKPESSDDSGDSAGEPLPSPLECDTTVHEAEIGRCVVPPTPCAEHSECGEYERCNKASVGSTCGASADDTGSGPEDGSWPAPDCGDSPEPEDQMGTCGPGNFTCEGDSDCPREFECQVTGGGDDGGCACVTTPCDCESTVSETKSCMPKQIECDLDAECPEDWACQGTSIVTCTGGGISDDASDGGSDPRGDSPMPPPAEDGTSDDSDDAAPKEECTTVTRKGACLPKAWSSYDAAPGAGGPRDDGVNEEGDDLGLSDGGDDSPPPDKDNGNPASPTGGDDGSGESADVSTSKGGCSVGPRMSAPSPGLWVIGIALMGAFVRRRRNAA